MTTQPVIRRISGGEVADFIADVARLRIAVFREFPYLYDGTFEYEQQYLQTYIDCDQSVLVLALDGDSVVGASTALPLSFETDEFRAPLALAGYNTDKVFYCAESVLLAPYRGLGLGWRFFEEREAHAAQIGDFDYSCFCAVVRPPDHPLRPPRYRGLDSLWARRGYVRQPIHTQYHWKDIDQPEETGKTMVYWHKRLKP